MGGFGSGRPSGGGKTCVEHMRRLDVRQLARAGYLEPGQSYAWSWTATDIRVKVGDDRLELAYRANDRDMRYGIWLDRTPCTYGGTRIWWSCPAIGCGRRCAVLYGGPTFACRRCYRLAYASQREEPDDRARRRAEKIRRRMGWPPGMIHGIGPKPPRMHWRTFSRLVAEYRVFEQATTAGMVHLLERMGSKLGRLGL